MSIKDLQNNINQEERPEFFLPDFCHVRSVFMVVLVSELLAFILALVGFQAEVFWIDLGRYSIIIQWIALLSTALLCMSRPFLRKLSDLRSGLLSYCLVLVVTLVVTVGAIWIEGWLRGATTVHLLDHPDFFGNLLVAAILAAVMLRVLYLQSQYRKRISIAADAKLEALQARIHPHFLFNSMNIIASLIPVNPELAEKVVEDLSDLFRASLAEHRSQVSLQSEVDLCKRYLGIEQLRLGERLQCDWQLPDSLDSVTIPPLTLQPLIENAIYHGIQPLVDGGLVSIKISIVNNLCTVCIENPIAPESVSTRVGDGNHIAIDNIKERLKMLYQNTASITLKFVKDKCVVTLILPTEEAVNENPIG